MMSESKPPWTYHRSVKYHYHSKSFDDYYPYFAWKPGEVREETVFEAILIFSFQIQALKVLVNLSSNPDVMDDIVQAQVRITK